MTPAAIKGSHWDRVKVRSLIRYEAFASLIQTVPTQLWMKGYSHNNPV